MWYRSPEVLMGLSYATPVDIWSCGCIFAELFLRKPLFPGQYEMDQLTKIFDIVGTPSERDWPERAAVTRSNFRDSPTRSWTDVVPEMDPQAKDLIQVDNKFAVLFGIQLLFFVVFSTLSYLLILPVNNIIIS